MSTTGNTIVFSLKDNKDDEMRKTLIAIYNALLEKGYDHPIDQIVGWIISEDPTYITNHNGARSMVRNIDRDELLVKMIKSYLNGK